MPMLQEDKACAPRNMRARFHYARAPGQARTCLGQTPELVLARWSAPIGVKRAVYP